MKAALRLLLLPLWLGLSLTSCQKEYSNGTQNNPGADNPVSVNITATVSGRVTNEMGEPVKGAVVTAGSTTAITGVDGLFRLNNASLMDQAAFIKADKTGYFTGSRTFIARQGQTHYVEMQLIPRNNVGNINGAAGGMITLGNGSSITLPANGVVNEASGVAYTGTVQVAMTCLDPTASNLTRIMPGDLRGVDESGNERGLVSYGMIGVELSGSGGEKLQIAAGKKASLKFPLPSATQSNAPATIALWSFNETTGLWKQEGTAARVGNNYEAQVSHFSFWNCDAPFLNVQLSATFKDQSGQPLAHKYVKITRLGTGWLGQACGFTDSTGYIKGIVPQNEPLLIEVLANSGCTAAVYSQNIGPFSSNASANLGVITVTVSNLSSFTVTGTATSCAGGPVTDGYAEIRAGYHTFRSPVIAGSFSLNFINCAPTQQITYVVVDNTTSQQSAPVTTTINSGSTALGAISACGISSLQSLNFTIDGVSYNLTSPADSLTANTIQQGAPSTSSEVSGMGGGSANKYIYFRFNGIATGAFPLSGIFVNVPTMTDSVKLSTASPVTVNITEYGQVGGYIAGNFNGTLQGFSSPTHTIQCNFRVKRRQ